MAEVIRWPFVQFYRSQSSFLLLCPLSSDMKPDAFMVLYFPPEPPKLSTHNLTFHWLIYSAFVLVLQMPTKILFVTFPRVVFPLRLVFGGEGLRMGSAQA